MWTSELVGEGITDVADKRGEHATAHAGRTRFAFSALKRAEPATVLGVHMFSTFACLLCGLVGSIRVDTGGVPPGRCFWTRSAS